jgi:tRNA threonylcarbamoyladenosine biosynthesis protein TsaE
VDNRQAVCETPEDTFELGRRLGTSLGGGEVVLLHGGLGAGKTLFTKGIVDSLGFDTDEVTSPSFTFVNVYRTERFDVYHVDLWRLEAGPGITDAVGLDDILEDEMAVLVIEWAERLGRHSFDRPVIDVSINGDGESPREIKILAETPLRLMTPGNP